MMRLELRLPHFWSSLFVLMAICLYSIVFPDIFNQLVEKLCFSLGVCASIVEYRDAQALWQFGIPDYARGFEALRLLAVPLTIIFSIFYFVIIYVHGAYDTYQMTRVQLICRVIAILTSLYLVFLKADFYGAADGDFSGFFRPPVGSFLWGGAVMLVSILAVTLPAIFLSKNANS